ncbi:MAG: SDR family NAD(P)-dependent oxidoreductase [Defluviitaleaceae bacterium]|nr:SDR family NAD(P)-dependent oxidoreductase [Defluviitaleaceae bacterium]
MDMFNLQGKTALVTGGTQGLGKGMATGLAKAGADIIIAARRPKPDTVAEIEALGVKCCYISVDLSDTEHIAEFVEAVWKLAPVVDILVNCAGINIRHPSIQFPKEDWDKILRVNLDAPFLLCQAFAKPMLERKYGKIINVSSLLAFQGGLTVPAYAASKGAIAQMTKALANEWAKDGVNVNGLIPGYFETEMNTALIADQTRSRQILERIPQGRWGRTEDVEGVAVFMASRASDYMNGAMVAIDGGWLGR